MTSIANGDKRRRASTGISKRRPNGPIANGDAFDHEERFGGQNGPHLQKTASGQQGAGPTAVPPTRRLRRPGQPGPTNSLARTEQPNSPSRTTRRPRSNGSSAVNPDRTVRQLGSNSSSAQINQFLIYALRTLTSIGARTAHAIKFIGNQTKRRKAHGERYHERHKQNRELHDKPLSQTQKLLSHARRESFAKESSPFRRAREKSNSLESACRMNVKPTQSAGQK